MRRPARYALPAIVVGAFLLRALPLLRANGAVDSADYDEGVYVGTSALFTHGFMPYRDFGFVHPPGIALLLAPVVWIGNAIGGYGFAFVASRWLVCVVGAFNTYLVGRLGTRWLGKAGGLVAAILYATFFAAVLNEGRVELEPFLNLVCLAAAVLWLHGGPSGRRAAIAVGAMVGAAAANKLYGFLYLVPILATAEGPVFGSQRRRVVASATAAFAVIMTPFVVIAGLERTWNSIVVAQLRRPGGGDVLGGDVQGWTRRVGQAFAYGPLGGHDLPSIVGVGLLLVMVGVAVLALRLGGRDGRFWVIALASGLALFLQSPSFFETYPVFLAPAASLLIAHATSFAIERIPDRRFAIGVVGALLAGVIGYSVRTHVLNRYIRLDHLPNEAARIEPAIQGANCVYADPPHWALVTDRLPDPIGNGDIVIDSFGDPFITAAEGGDSFATPEEARLNPAFQSRLRAAIGSCDTALLIADPTNRGDWTAETSEWFTTHYREVLPITELGPGVYQLVTK